MVFLVTSTIFYYDKKPLCVEVIGLKHWIFLNHISHYEVEWNFIPELAQRGISVCKELGYEKRFLPPGNKKPSMIVRGYMDVHDHLTKLNGRFFELGKIERTLV